MWGILGAVALLLDVAALLDILRQPAPPEDKITWVLLVWLFPYMGLVLYVALGRRRLAERAGARPYSS